MSRSFKLDRRTLLRGAGVSIALPWLEAMSLGAATKTAIPPKRLCSILFPFGIGLRPDDDPERDWCWFPRGSGKDYQLTNVLEPLAPHMDDVSIFGGLSHPECRTMNGHDTGDTFLTGSRLATGTYKNTVSLDQFAAHHLGEQTRHASLTLSTDGGIGPRTRTTTLSYTMKGQPIPALSQPRQIFNRLFGQDSASRADRARLESSGSILDLVLDQSKSLRRDLGTADRNKLDEYQTSIREVEQRVERAQSWLEVPYPEVDPSSLLLDADPEDAIAYLETIYDLIFISFQTDLTRIATYLIGSYGPSKARAFPAAVGLKPDWHGLAHAANKKGQAEALGKFDRFLAEHLARFIKRLADTPDGETGDSLLDRTLILYGSSNSKTHVNKNYPLLLAGGGKLGLKHNQYLRFGEDVPMANLFLSMIQAMGIDADSFADSTGPLEGLA